ncbi:hypothetical protein GCM10007301_16980 [Azorhizobium oxalatiphilum]|uniref:Uncharacterized protein n=1 Tax=Azorhizobium oxalatiphilum TaxID=980631 RepID=A0A917BT93_9HYPH|nr:hypothetical protein [Azorhizobium oxalatiphilum]GGF57870.1 hypothetical protein GCM10007301_16980 [Azorhizobium oxalatiphilum]
MSGSDQRPMSDSDQRPVGDSDQRPVSGSAPKDAGASRTPPQVSANDTSALVRLEQLCREIARGDHDHADDLFDLTVAADASEVVHSLAEAFGFMLVQVEAREMHLTNLIDDLTELKGELEIANQRLEKENAQLTGQLKRLTVEIDRHELNKNVGAIVDTEYFQDLQQRAREMRARHLPRDRAQDE